MSTSSGTAAVAPSSGPAGANSAPAAGEKGRKKEIYTYEASWNIYSVGCSQKAGPEYEFRFAVGSFIEEYCNKVQVNAAQGLMMMFGNVEGVEGCSKRGLFVVVHLRPCWHDDTPFGHLHRLQHKFLSSSAPSVTIHTLLLTTRADSAT